MKRSQFTFQTEDRLEINVYRWEKETKEVRGVIQIAHGMVEHALRYEPFAAFLTEHGFIVYANDHRGHGKSYQHLSERGFFAESNGFERVVRDMKQLYAMIHEKHPEVPIFLFGHSMGSFLARRYIQLNGEDFSGVILSGTGGDQKLLGKAGLAVAKLERKFRGARTPSPLMDKLIFGNYNKNFAPARTKFDFLSRDETIVDAYVADDNCGFIATAGFYVDLLTGLELIHRDSEVASIPKTLPIFLLSGDLDPVGNEGKGVQGVYEQYVRHEIENVSIKLYEDGRHEMLNETNRDEVLSDILNWLETMMKGEED